MTSAPVTAGRRVWRVLWALAALAAFAGFMALGIWQIERRAWKLDLIERVENRVTAPAVAAPSPSQWAASDPADYEYRRVRLTGTFLHQHETLVQAATALGSGYWVLTPLRRAEGGLVLVNRGFVPPDRRERSTRRAGEPEGPVTLTGLLRLSEPGGAFLRDNAPDHNRWYSRDVAAIAEARGLTGVAPYFVDAEAPPSAEGGADQPVAGLTVIRFRNNHLVYALTWFILALMVAGGAGYAAREEFRSRRSGDPR
ncbi:MAG TPA: SURF1 family protein [Alcanivorax sp.]|nr:SURF1 family protein [Alcanivorax sp.]